MIYNTFDLHNRQKELLAEALTRPVYVKRRGVVFKITAVDHVDKIETIPADKIETIPADKINSDVSAKIVDNTATGNIISDL